MYSESFSHSVSHFLPLIMVSLDEMSLILMKLQFVKIFMVILFVPCLRTRWTCRCSPVVIWKHYKFYLPHLDLQPIWNWFLCIVSGRDQDIFFPCMYLVDPVLFIKDYLLYSCEPNICVRFNIVSLFPQGCNFIFYN